MNKQDVVDKLNMRFGKKEHDPLFNVFHSHPSMDDWEELRVEMSEAISKELGLTVEVLDDATVEWQYDEPDALAIGWVETDEKRWTFQQYDAYELQRSLAADLERMPPYGRYATRKFSTHE